MHGLGTKARTACGADRLKPSYTWPTELDSGERGGVNSPAGQFVVLGNIRVGRVIETHHELRAFWWVSMTRPTLRLKNEVDPQ